MGADAFIVFYGVRFDVGDADESESLAVKNDTRLALAKRGGLDTYIGRVTDGEPYFLFVGRRLGLFGVEGATSMSFKTEELAQLATETDTRLSALGIRGEPKFWFQLEAQY